VNYVVELFAAIESNDLSRLWRLFPTLSEADAVAAATNIGPDRIRDLLYWNVRKSSMQIAPFPSFFAQPIAFNNPLFSMVENCDPALVLPAVLARAFKDRSFLGTSPDNALLSRVQGYLTALHARRAALPLITLSRDVTRTLLAPSACPAPLTDVQFTDAAARLGVEVAAIKAVAKVESGGRIAFDSKYRASILFEAHQFRKYSLRQFDLTHPHLSCASDIASNYYPWDQYNRLYEALVLSPVAAIKACSWGKFQVMGFNHNGWPDPISFAHAMQMSETNQLKAFEDYCRATGAASHLKNKDWTKFAVAYNGPKTKGYDTLMAAAYKQYLVK
jgi:N-acetylmuramidase